MIKNERGQLLVGVIVIMVLLAIFIPAMVRYVQNETKWSQKQGESTKAFQLAEAALDRGYQKVTESTATWTAIQAGTAQAGYHLDTAYAELVAGTYAISITSGPGNQVVTIIGIGRDKNNREVRALKAVYANNPLSGVAIQSGNTVTLSGTNEVEWGAVMSAKTISLAANTNHPQFYSSGNITNKDANGATPPNTDSVQWWSYYPNIPPAPYIDFDFYRSSAIATGTCISEVTTGIYAGCVNSGINQCNPTGWSGGGDHDCSSGAGSKACKGYSWFINCPTNGITITSNNNTWLIGNMIIIGNLTVQASAASGAPTAKVPQTAWRQYGNDWNYYLTNFTSGAGCTANLPAAFPGLNSTYLSPAGCSYNDGTKFANVLNHGFLYVSGNATFQSGGITEVWGAAYIAGTVSVATGGYIVFFDPSVSQGLLTTRILLTRTSWQDTVQPWPAGL